MLVLPLNLPAKLRLLAADGTGTLYGRVRIYNFAGTLIADLSTTHIAGGLYEASWTPTVAGQYTAVGVFYADPGYTIDAGYERTSEEIDVNTDRAALSRLLGLSQENMVVDDQVYDGEGHLLSARVRLYDTPANAMAAGVTGMIARYTVTAAYSGHLLIDYKVVRSA